MSFTAAIKLYVALPYIERNTMPKVSTNCFFFRGCHSRVYEKRVIHFKECDLYVGHGHGLGHAHDFVAVVDYLITIDQTYVDP